MSTKKGTIALGSSAMLASALLAGCSSGNSHAQLNSVGVCMDKTTHKRLPDSDCDHTSHVGGISPAWVYYGMGRNVAGIGSPLSGYSTTVPQGTYARGGYAAQGGKVDLSKINGSASVFDGTGAKGGSAGKAVGSVAKGGFGAHAEGGHGG